MRLIDADHLKEVMQDVYPLTVNDFGNKVNAKIYEIIDNAPTISPIQTIPVVNCSECKIGRPVGRWVEHTDRANNKYSCNICGSFASRKGSFCSCCGAKMKKEVCDV